MDGESYGVEIGNGVTAADGKVEKVRNGARNDRNGHGGDVVTQAPEGQKHLGRRRRMEVGGWWCACSGCGWTFAG